MEESDTRLAVQEPVPQWLRVIGIGLGVLLVPPFVIPIVLLVMGMGVLAFVPFLPLLIAEFIYSARNTAVSEAKELELERTSWARRDHRPRPA
jgi:hypothetical protein